MITPPIPQNEQQRLEEVKKYELLDTLPEAHFDAITQLVSNICDTPIALITLLDKERNFLKSRVGVDLSESPRSISFCGHAITNETPLFIVEDAREDHRFYDNPLIKEHGIVFYAGAPLVNENNAPLGTVCVYDLKPRKLNPQQQEFLTLMAKQVVNLFELHYKNIQLDKLQTELKLRNERLEKFASVVSHDLKSPLANITSLTQLLLEENKNTLTTDSFTYIEYIQESSQTLRNYIEGMLGFYKTTKVLEFPKEEINLNLIIEKIENLLGKQGKIEAPQENIILFANKNALFQILLNLVDNAFKYNLSSHPKATITFTETQQNYEFSVIDNGIGIPIEKQNQVFELFNTVGLRDIEQIEGTGIGLATVYNLVTKLNGNITLKSTLGSGSNFTFSIKK